MKSSMQARGVSIVVPCLNQARLLETTLTSLAQQRYAGLDVVVEDRGSTDASLDVSRDFAVRFPELFRVFSDAGIAEGEALNRGFARAKAEVLGWLSPGDALLPAVATRVASEVEPARKRWVVMGRCCFSGETLCSPNVEFPIGSASRFDHLAVWKRGFTGIPRPSVFWHRDAWNSCGGFDSSLRHALDYDLFCRLMRRYRFWFVDEAWSTLCIDNTPLAAQCADADLLDLDIEVSRRNWGPWYSPLRWRCRISLWMHSRHSHEHARHHARKAESAMRARRLAIAMRELLQTARFSPRMAWHRLLLGWLAVTTRAIQERVRRWSSRKSA